MNVQEYHRGRSKAIFPGARLLHRFASHNDGASTELRQSRFSAAILGELGEIDQSTILTFDFSWDSPIRWPLKVGPDRRAGRRGAARPEVAPYLSPEVHRELLRFSRGGDHAEQMTKNPRRNGRPRKTPLLERRDESRLSNNRRQVHCASFVHHGVDERKAANSPAGVPGSGYLTCDRNRSGNRSRPFRTSDLCITKTSSIQGRFSIRVGVSSKKPL